MDNNVQLPAEVLEEIKLKAEAFAAGMWPGISVHDRKQREYVAAVYESGAIEYAQDYKTARALLEKFIYRHEAGLLPDRFIYNEIKTFLDGK